MNAFRDLFERTQDLKLRGALKASFVVPAVQQKHETVSCQWQDKILKLSTQRTEGGRFGRW